MTFSTVTDEEELAALFPEIDRFVESYNPASPTLLLLPGGMASSLIQATQTYAAQPTPPYTYELNWLGLQTLNGGVNNLAMDGAQTANDRITIAPDVVGLCGISPYSVFVLWCKNRTTPFNYLIVPWDWRLSPANAARLVVDTVLPAIQLGILSRHGVDFQQTGFNLVSHSFGGLVLKLVLDGGGPWSNAIQKAITVASPFYGYGGSQHFYFAGFSPLTSFYSKSDLALVIGSLPGPYTLMYLDQATYALAATGLAADANYPLCNYPSVDAETGDAVDPYAPGALRYPGWVNATELAEAAGLRSTIAARSPPAERGKLYAIRGVQTHLSGAILANTFTTQTWGTISASFDPDAGLDPITSHLGPGDDTIPAWSARLVWMAEDHVISVSGPTVEHMTLMDNPAVLQKLEGLVGGPRLSAEILEELHLKFNDTWDHTATRQELAAFLRTAALVGQDGRFDDGLATLLVQERQRLIRRFLKDLPRAPLGVPAQQPSYRARDD